MGGGQADDRVVAPGQLLAGLDAGGRVRVKDVAGRFVEVANGGQGLVVVHRGRQEDLADLGDLPGVEGELDRSRQTAAWRSPGAPSPL